MKNQKRRVVGLDIHPDSFAGAILEGSDPATARPTSTSTRVPLSQLEQWAEAHTTGHDVLVMEAGGNSLAVARRLRALKRKVIILESHQAGMIGKTYCANDRVDAVISRFSHSRKLVAYVGLNPSVCESGNWEGGGALKRHGRGPLRALLIQSAKKLLLVKNPLQKWGLSVAARRGRNKAAVAVARKLLVAVWHVMQGHAIGVIDRMDSLHTKIFKFATELGLPQIKALGYETKEAFVQKKLYILRGYP